MESQSDFLIASPEKVISKLSVLLKNKNLLTVRNERGVTFVSTILEVDKKDQIFICDGCEENLVEQMLESSKVMFRTEHMGALVTFDSSQIKKTKYDGNLAFLLPLPSALRWLEQREFYRVRVPPASTSRCQIVAEDHPDPLNFKLFDISIRGFSVLNPDPELSDLFKLNAKFTKCKLILDNKEEITIAFEVRSKFMINPDGLNPTEKIGCKFSAITVSFENAIHGYMLAIEREMLKKRIESGHFA